jgi:hypothetical protein
MAAGGHDADPELIMGVTGKLAGRLQTYSFYPGNSSAVLMKVVQGVSSFVILPASVFFMKSGQTLIARELEKVGDSRRFVINPDETSPFSSRWRIQKWSCTSIAPSSHESSWMGV